jgi:glutamate-1-semialdehyde aminotransferase
MRCSFDEVVTGFRLGLGGAQGLREARSHDLREGCVTGGYPMAGGVGGRRGSSALGRRPGRQNRCARLHRWNALREPPPCVAGYTPFSRWANGDPGHRRSRRRQADIRGSRVSSCEDACPSWLITGVHRSPRDFGRDAPRPSKSRRALREPHKHMMEEMGAAYMAEGLVTLSTCTRAWRTPTPSSTTTLERFDRSSRIGSPSCVSERRAGRARGRLGTSGMVALVTSAAQVLGLESQSVASITADGGPNRRPASGGGHFSR